MKGRIISPELTDQLVNQHIVYEADTCRYVIIHPKKYANKVKSWKIVESVHVFTEK